MIVGVAVVELRIHASQSLNEKRGVVRKLVGRLRHRFNLSVAEVGGQETWQRAVIGLAMAGSDEGIVRKTLRRALEFVEETHLAEVLDSDLELMRMPLEAAPFLSPDEVDDDEFEDDEGCERGEREEESEEEVVLFEERVEDWARPWTRAGRGKQGSGED